jgi:hypothetical protein
MGMTCGGGVVGVGVQPWTHIAEAEVAKLMARTAPTEARMVLKERFMENSLRLN